jgi:hypothetical protein
VQFIAQMLSSAGAVLGFVNRGADFFCRLPTPKIMVTFVLGILWV